MHRIISLVAVAIIAATAGILILTLLGVPTGLEGGGRQ